jgi:glycosyltransferase involved in cell wall biosynthesis
MIDLCLVVIARDASRSIERCLRSAAPIVQRMLVLDTGSTDDTVAISKACGAEVHHFAWVDDFSAARNRSLELAQAGWALILDADEWFEWTNPPALATARQLLSDHMSQHPASPGLLRVRSETLLEGRIETADAWLPRFLPGDARYRGRIHEQPVTSGLGCQIDLTVMHDGYCVGDLEAKRQRNAALIQAALAEDPTSPYLHFQAGVEDEIQERWESACEHFAQAAQLTAGRLTPYSHPLAYRRLHALARAGRINEALELGLQAQSHWPDSSDVHFAFGNVCLDASLLDPAGALEVWLPAAESAWKQCLDIGECDRYEGHISGRGSYLAAQNLAVLYGGWAWANNVGHGLPRLGRYEAG